MLFEIEKDKEYWYQLLNCLPISPDSIEYKRLKRVWSDQTRFRGTKGTPNRRHLMFKFASEQNIQISIWENFSIFNKENFILELIKVSKLDLEIQDITNVSWSYEWEKPIYNNGYKIGIKLIDIVLKITTIKSEYLIVVECKNLTSALSKKDLNPSYYLDEIEEFDRFNKNKALLYCIGERAKKAVTEQIIQSDYKTGIITWESLAILQLNLVKNFDINQTVKKFISYSLIKQFQNKGIYVPVDNFSIDLDKDLIDFIGLDFNEVMEMNITDNIKGFICGVLFNQFPNTSRKKLPFEYLNHELKQNEMDKKEYQPRQEREFPIWDL